MSADQDNGGERLLETISTPEDLGGRSDEELQRIAQEIRELIIDTIGEIGGHFGANLGTCELTTVLHSLLASPRDKILWDVGHQAYPHKVLTGRRDRLETIRQYGGLAPFCSVFESEHDIMGAGHASTSVGYAVGLKEAMRHGIGDGLGGRGDRDGADRRGGVRGPAQRRRPADPGRDRAQRQRMSISPNVGAIARSFQRLRLRPRLYHARGRRGGADQAAARARAPVRAPRPEFKSAIKAYAAPGLFFEELTRLHGALRRPLGRRAAPGARGRAGGGTGRWSSTSTPSRARASSWPSRVGSRGWRSGTRRSLADCRRQGRRPWPSRPRRSRR